MAFSFDNKYLACTTDHNSVHLWSLEGKNHKGMIGKFKTLITPLHSNLKYDYSTMKIEFKHANNREFRVAFNDSKNNQI